MERANRAIEIIGVSLTGCDVGLRRQIFNIEVVSSGELDGGLHLLIAQKGQFLFQTVSFVVRWRLSFEVSLLASNLGAQLRDASYFFHQIIA